MKVIGGKKGSGKTTGLIKQCQALNNAYIEKTVIVCATAERAENIMSVAMEINRDIPTTMTFDDFIAGKWRGERIHGFMFDDLDDSLQLFCGNAKAIAATVSC